ncbi:ABC transporter substrate-binding protein [Mesorhizobium sp. A623]
MTKPIKLTYGLSLSNLPLLVAAGNGFFKEEGLDVIVPDLKTVSSTAKLLSDGEVHLGTAGFTHPFVGFLREDAPIMVAGSGLTGIALLSQPGITDASMLRGRSLATFRSDPMEVMAYEKLQQSGLSFADVKLTYIDDLNVALRMFREGELDSVTVVEPYASRLRAQGAVQLSNGSDLWGQQFPDTALIASQSFLRENPEAIEATVRAMVRAERVIKADLPGALVYVKDRYKGFDADELAAAALNQPPCIDFRPYTTMLLDRWPTLQALKLVPEGAEIPRHALQLDRFAHVFEST